MYSGGGRFGLRSALRPLLCAALVLGGCAARATAPPKNPEATVETDASSELTTQTIVVSESEAVDVATLLERAQTALDRSEHEAAAKDFRLVSEHAEDPEVRLRALLGLGTALDLGGHPDEALAVYARYVQEEPRAEERNRITVRVIRLLVYRERYQEAGKRAAALSLEGLTPLQQLAVFGARALSALAAGREEQAETDIARGRSIIDAHSLDRVRVPPLEAAALFFALGELHQARAEAIEFDPIPADFAALLEKRCAHILDAQAAYSDAMRSEDAHWSSMAGVRVGELYQSLHEELTAMPPPPEAKTTSQRQLFEGAMRLRYSILLRKSVAMMRSTVALLDRTHQDSRWRQKARDALLEIEAAEVREQASIDALPYSRAQLQQALDDLAARAQSAQKDKSGS